MYMKRYSLCLYIALLPAAQKLSLFDEELFLWSRTFAELMHLVDTSYYVTIHPKDALCKAMDAFISFDPHSKFLDPAAYDALKNITKGQFFGIGVLLAHKEPRDATVLITDCVPQSPADTVGIQSYDLIIA